MIKNDMLDKKKPKRLRVWSKLPQQLFVCFFQRLIKSSLVMVTVFEKKNSIMALFLSLFALFSLGISGQTVMVNPCTGGNTLQEAVDEVVSNDMPNQVILIDPYLFTNEFPGGNWGLATLVGTVGNNLNGLVIDGQGAYIDATAAGLGFFDISNIDGLTIRNFTFDGFNRSAGSLVIDNCENLLLENVNFVNGSTTQPVIISAENGNTSVTIRNCLFSGNPLSSDSPTPTVNSGAVRINGDANNSLIVTFEDTQFRCNARLTDGGGAVQINGDGSAPDRTLTTVNFTGCEFANNIQNSGSGGGGAIYASNTLTVNVSDCNFYNNTVVSSTATAGGGGAININASVDLNVSGSYFLDNMVTGASGAPDGGAIATNGGSSNPNNVTISNSVFAGNSCTDEGGAIFLRHLRNGSITNTLFANNNSPDGGALHIENNNLTTLTLDGITVTGTTGGAGQGVSNDGGASIIMDNSIVVNNVGTNFSGSFSGTDNTTSGSVIFTNPMPGGETNPGGYNYDVTGSQGIMLGDLEDVSSNTDCGAIEEVTTPPVGAMNCQPLPSCDANAGILPVDPAGCQEFTNVVGGTSIIDVLSYDFNNGVNYTQVYFITNGTDVLEAISVAGTGVTPIAAATSTDTYTAGMYTVYVVNYQTSDANAVATVTNLTNLPTTVVDIEAVPTNIATDCIVRAANAMIVEVCDPTEDCDDGTTSGAINAITNVPGSYNPQYGQTYLLADGTGLIIDIQESAAFQNLPTGNYQVYAINYSMIPVENPFVNGVSWSAITVNLTNISDLSITPGLADACFELGVGQSYMVNACVNCPVLSNPSADQTVCLGGLPSDITTETDDNTIDIEFVYFTTQQTGTDMYTNGGTAIGTAQTPVGAGTPYVATANAADLPTVGGTYYIYAILDTDDPDLTDPTCRPFQEIVLVINNVNCDTYPWTGN